MKTNHILGLVLSLVLSHEAFAQQKGTVKKNAPTKSSIPAKSGLSIDDYLKQALIDKSALKDALLKDQSSVDSDAVCRLKYGQAQLRYISRFEKDAEEIKALIEARRTALKTPQEDLRKNLSTLNTFEVTTLPTESQSRDAADGLLKLRMNAQKTEVLVSLFDAIRFMDLFNQRIKACYKDEKTMDKMVELNKKSFQDPMSNPLGLTYDQVEESLTNLGNILNAKLKSNGITYELSYLKPTSERCQATIELVQKVTIEGLEKTMDNRYALSFDAKQNQILVQGLAHSSETISDQMALSSLNDQHALLSSKESIDGYARWVKNIKKEVPEICQEQFGLDQLASGVADIPYVSAKTVVKVQKDLRGSELNEVFPLIFADSSGYAVYLNGGKLYTVETKNAPSKEIDFGGKSVKRVYAGSNSLFAQCEDGTIFGWGYNAQGQLGVGNADLHGTPVEVVAFRGKKVKSISVGSSHALAILEDGAVMGWGRNDYGGLGNGSTSTSQKTPIEISFFKGLKPRLVVAGNYSSFAVLEDGRVFAWGYNYEGMLGLGNNSNQSAPQEVTALRGLKIRKLVSGTYSSLVLLEDGSVRSWGYNPYGQLGNDLGRSSSTPLELVSLRDRKVKDIALGSNHGFALLEDGTLLGWGRSADGQLAQTAGADVTVPTVIAALKDQRITSVSTLGNTSLVMLENGKILGWGTNTSSILGKNVPSPSTTPVEITLPAIKAN